MNISSTALLRTEQPNLTRSNRLLRDLSPAAIVDWTVLNARRLILTTNFRPLSVALLHLVTRIKPDIPVLWVDSGYNTVATYQFVDELTAKLGLNLHVYKPRTAAVRDPRARPAIPDIGTPAHANFTRSVKLEPFERALDEWRPDYWITGIRHDQTDYRRSLDIVTTGPHGVVRVAPLFYWSEVDVEGYIYDHELADYDDYFDPTKGPDNRECGLQTLA